MIGDVLQPTHLIFILVVALLVLGPKRLPEVGRSLGKGIRDFRGALSGAEEPAAHEPEAVTPAETPAAPVTPATTSLSDEDSRATAVVSAEDPPSHVAVTPDAVEVPTEAAQPEGGDPAAEEPHPVAPAADSAPQRH